MRKQTAIATLITLAVGLGGYLLGTVHAGEKPKIANLLREGLADTPKREVIVTRLELPANAAIPRHYHHGTEFIYVLEGEATLHTAGERPRTLRAGQATHIPYRKVHWGRNGARRSKVVIFRVHQAGKPIRVPVKR